jgi:ABC-type transport system involved in cytochrome c biogenesis permease subunit
VRSIRTFGHGVCGRLPMSAGSWCANIKAEVIPVTVSPEVSPAAPAGRRWSLRGLIPEFWASLSIAVIWLSVLFTGVYGPDIVISNSSGLSKIPSVIVVVAFAYLATRVIARFGFGQRSPSQT